MSPNTREAKPIHFVVERSNLRHCRFVNAPGAGEIELQPGQALLRVASFAFTANNVTYAVAGDMLSYWSFFSGLGSRRTPEALHVRVARVSRLHAEPHPHRARKWEGRRRACLPGDAGGPVTP